jgi:hypothetical protein
MHRCKVCTLISINSLTRYVPKLLLHRLQKYFLLFLCLIACCISPALAIAAQSRLPGDSSRLAVQPYVSIENQERMDSNKGYFKGLISDLESSITIPKDGNTIRDLTKGYVTGKQAPVPERDSAKNSWIITPLFEGYTNSSLAAHIPIGIILKLRF